MGNWRNVRTVLMAASLLVMIVGMQQTGFAQGSAAGSIQGTVTDPSGASLPGVLVTVTATQTNLTRTVTTGDDGIYNVPGLAIGAYTIKAEKTGFGSRVTENAQVSVGKASLVDIQLTVGSTTETVDVQAQVAPITEDKPDRGVVLEAQTLQNLPLQVAGGARQADAFLTLAPGVTGDTFSARINGAPDFSQDFYYDGIPYMNADGGGRQEGAGAPFESVDEYSIQTNAYAAQYGRGAGLLNFHLRSGTNRLHGGAYEYLRNDALDAPGFFGRGPHTEKQHEYGFKVGGPVYIPKIYNGKDKTFFFFNIDWYKFRGGTSNSLITLPTDAMRNGDFSALLGGQVGEVNPCDGSQVLVGQIFDPLTTQTVGGKVCRTAFAGNVIPVGRLSALSSQYIDLIPHSGNQNPTLNTPVAVPASPQDNRFYLIKADHSFNSWLTMHGSYYYGRTNGPTTPQFSGPLGTGNNFNVNFWEPRLSLDQTITPHIFNQILYSVQYTEGVRIFFPTVPADFTSPISTPGQPFPALAVAGMPLFGTGSDNGQNSGGCWPCTFFADNVKWIKGRHSLAFGTEMRWEDEKDAFATNIGTYNFGTGTTSLPFSANSGVLGFGFAGLFLGTPNQVSRTGVADQRLAKTGYRALYIQDDIKVSSKFTLNVGLRWDVSLPAWNGAGFFSTFDPTVPNPGAGNRLGSIVFAGNSGVGGCIDAGGSSTCRPKLADTYWNTFQPRFGFAYRLTGKTTLRGGFGISTIRGGATSLMGPSIAANFLAGYQVQDTLSSPDGGFSVPTQIQPTWDSGIPAVPALAPRTRDLLNGQPLAQMRRVDGKPGYVQMWSATVEHELPWRIALEASYVGSSSVRTGANLLNENQTPVSALALGPLLNADINSPEAIAAGIPLPFPGFTGTVNQALRPFPQYQFINSTTQNTGHQSYNSFQGRAQKYFSDGLTFLASFTLSKTYTNSVDQFSTFGASGLDTANPDRERRVLGVGLFNSASPRTLSIASTYELPIGPGKRYMSGGGVKGKIIGGWGLSALLQYNAGGNLPITGGTPNPIFNGPPRPNLVPGAKLKGYTGKFDPRADRYINVNAFTDAGAFALGDAEASLDLRTFAFLNENISLIKDTKVGEGVVVEFRADAFNIFNRTVFATPDTNWNDRVTNAFGQVNGQGNTPRVLQLGLRVDF